MIHKTAYEPSVMKLVNPIYQLFLKIALLFPFSLLRQMETYNFEIRFCLSLQIPERHV